MKKPLPGKYYECEGKSMPSISVIMATARDDYPIIGLPQLHMLQPTIESLNIQSFKDFEFIICDAIYDRRPNLFHGEPFNMEKLPFQVKHVPVDTKHRFWLDRKRWNLCGQLNTGIMHSEGDMIIRIDDCCEFGSDYLMKFWDGYQRGYFPLAMHIRYLNGKPARVNREYMEKGYEAAGHYRSQTWEHNADEILKKIYGENGLIRDTRYEKVKAAGGTMIAPPDWYYGYSSMSIEAALKVNGFDENFDADKSLEDPDMGSRLEMAGYKNKFLLDVNHQVIEHEHGPVSQGLFNSNLKPVKCNYALFLLNRKNRRYRANSGKFAGEDIEFIRQESRKAPCSPDGIPDFYEDDCKGDAFETWMFRQPVFDLEKERKRVLEC
ncbi:glycosyltransferase family 2 protein [Patescibacteria group bacterium]|nr:glycosyltransferase family 2 protein [Patescibacteria group bacterium]